MLCYNFGVEDCRAKRFEESTRWLKESYDLRCGQEGISAKNQASDWVGFMGDMLIRNIGLWWMWK